MKILSEDAAVLAALDRETYCGRLGHFVPLRYCLHPAQEVPCFKILDCWWQQFDVLSFLRDHVPGDTLAGVLERKSAPNKLEGILKILSDLEKSGGRG